MSAVSVRGRLSVVRARIAEACERVGRQPSDVTLVAVSKRKSVTAIGEAYAEGQRDFGENYAQELRDKAAELAPQLPDLRWHFVGTVQRNKVKYLVGRTALLHSIDSTAQIEAIGQFAQRLGVEQHVLLQVNLSGETSKAGATQQQAARLLAICDETNAIRCVGLMTMPPAAGPNGDNRTYFSQLRQLRDRLASSKALPHLSMGMTADFETAIEEGATLVRVGTAIFGARA